jgi:hypothetical protein
MFSWVPNSSNFSSLNIRPCLFGFLSYFVDKILNSVSVRNKTITREYRNRVSTSCCQRCWLVRMAENDVVIAHKEKPMLRLSPQNSPCIRLTAVSGIAQPCIKQHCRKWSADHWFRIYCITLISSAGIRFLVRFKMLIYIYACYFHRLYAPEFLFGRIWLTSHHKNFNVETETFIYLWTIYLP